MKRKEFQEIVQDWLEVLDMEHFDEEEELNSLRCEIEKELAEELV